MVASVCDMAFASMSIQSILDNHSGCKVKCNKEFAEHEGPAKVHKEKKSKVMRTKRDILVAQSRCC